MPKLTAYSHPDGEKLVEAILKLYKDDPDMYDRHVAPLIEDYPHFVDIPKAAFAKVAKVLATLNAKANKVSVKEFDRATVRKLRDQIEEALSSIKLSGAKLAGDITGRYSRDSVTYKITFVIPERAQEEDNGWLKPFGLHVGKTFKLPNGDTCKITGYKPRGKYRVSFINLKTGKPLRGTTSHIQQLVSNK